jgi:hypothetical protein
MLESIERFELYSSVSVTFSSKPVGKYHGIGQPLELLYHVMPSQYVFSYS